MRLFRFCLLLHCSNCVEVRDLSPCCDHVNNVLRQKDEKFSGVLALSDAKIGSIARDVQHHGKVNNYSLMFRSLER